MIHSLSMQLQALHRLLALFKVGKKGQDFLSQQALFIKEQNPSQKVSPASSLPFVSHQMEPGHMSTPKSQSAKASGLPCPDLGQIWSIP